MKKQFLIVLALLSIFFCQAQTSINQAEYFWDTDPGQGNGTAVLAADGNFASAFEQLSKTGIAAPSAGLHKFNIRVKDNTGAWGPVFTNVINVTQLVTSTVVSISQAEYFWDTDPGQGNGTAVLAADGNFASAFEQLSKTGITAPAAGLHKFNIRIKDNTGVWGPVFTNVINVSSLVTSTPLAISQAECFWDTDPGQGNGTVLLAFDGNFNSAFEKVFNAEVAVPQTAGLHVFNVRIKDNTNVWGPVFKNVISIAVPPPVACVIAVAGGASNSFVIKSDGTLWGSGRNDFGELGDNTFVDRLTLTRIGTTSDFQRVYARQSNTFAIKTNGTLWAWGTNGYGGLGVNTVNSVRTPTQVGTDTNWKSVAPGSEHTIAVKTNGTLWAMGRNEYGQLGIGSTTDFRSPVQVDNATNWTSVGAGNVHSVGLKSDGTIWIWGYNGGQFGNGTTANSRVPIQVGTATNWKAIAVGANSTYAIKTDGTLWAWGNNYAGKLGDGTTVDKTVPTQIGTATNWLTISAGTEHAIATKTDGTVWAWGYNGDGQIGDGTFVNKLVPTKIGVATNWQTAVGGFAHNLAIKSDGSLWVWGRNIDGTLGDGTANTDRNAPFNLTCPGNPPLEVGEQQAIAALKAYPNPVDNILTISFSDEITAVSIYNLLGQEVIAKTINANEAKVDVSKLSAGTYLVKVYADNQAKTLKIIKR